MKSSGARFGHRFSPVAGIAVGALILHLAGGILESAGNPRIEQGSVGPAKVFIQYAQVRKAPPQPPPNHSAQDAGPIQLTVTPMPAAAARGGEISVTISVQSPPGTEPTALQWDVSYPPSQVGTQDGDLESGEAAKSAHKSLTCGGQPVDAATYVYHCILAGGRLPISNGPVARIRFHIRAYARPEPARVKLEKALGVVNGNGVPIRPSDIGLMFEKRPMVPR